MSFTLSTLRTAIRDYTEVDDTVLSDFITQFDMRPAAIIERLSLLDVDYRTDTLFSHFGHDDRNWEKIENI